jgi:hypothetical protein
VGGTTSSYTYSPTPFGWGNGEQALKSPENFPGGALNYVSGPCTIFFPYKVGHLLRPVTHFKRTWSKFTHFHVTTHSIPQFRPHHGCSCAADGASGRCLSVAGPPDTHEGAGAGGAHREPASLGVSKKAHRELVSFGCVEKFGCGEKFGCVENRPPRPRRPYLLAPAPAPARRGGPSRTSGGRVRTPRRQNISLVWTMVVWRGVPPPQVPGYISGPEVDPHCRATARAPGAPRCPARPASPWLPHGRHRGGAPGGGWAAPAPPTNWRALGVSKLWVCRKRPPAPSRPGPGLGLGLPAPVLAPTGQFSGVSLVPRRRLASLAAHDIPPPLLSPRPRLRPAPARAAHLPTGNWPAPRGPSPPPRRAGWPAPTAPPATAARGSPAAHRDRDRRHEGRGPQHAPTVGPPAWPVASRLVSLLPTRPLHLARRRNWPSSRVP